jgi:hypothetical protein
MFKPLVAVLFLVQREYVSPQCRKAFSGEKVFAKAMEVTGTNCQICVVVNVGGVRIYFFGALNVRYFV